jgi:hypothetical protein
MKDSRSGRFTPAIALLVGWIFLGLDPLFAQTAFVQTGTGTNQCRLVLNFPTGEKVVFQHRWNGASLNAKTLLESVIEATGGELVVTAGYLTPFTFAMEGMTNPTTTGLVVHYQNSYTAPYLNGIRWNGPGGPTGADYQYPENWWHLWVQGPAHVDQSFAWPDPLPPVDLQPGSAWFFGEFSGLADLTLSNGASIGLVYGTAGQPALPVPAVQSMVPASGNTFQIQFSSVPGERYQLESRSDLTAGNWTPLGDPIMATAGSTTTSVPANSPGDRGFYRIGLLP